VDIEEFHRNRSGMVDMKLWNAIILFLSIVWRKNDFDCPERISIKTAWQIASGIWFDKFKNVDLGIIGWRSHFLNLPCCTCGCLGNKECGHDPIPGHGCELNQIGECPCCENKVKNK
jgi:hypothetical protein